MLKFNTNILKRSFHGVLFILSSRESGGYLSSVDYMVTTTTSWKEYDVGERDQDFEDTASVKENCTGKVEYNFP